MTPSISRLSALLAAVSLLGAAPALADHGSGRGGDDQRQAQVSGSGENEGTEAAEPAENQGTEAAEPAETSSQTETKSSSNHRSRTEKYELRGTVTAIDVSAGTVSVQISRSNHGSRSTGLAGHTLTFDVSHARLKGRAGLDGISVGDAVRVTAVLPRPLPSDLSATFVATRLEDRS